MFSFGKKKCPYCGKSIKEDWKFCPYCGEELIKRKIKFPSIFDEIDKEFERIDKMFSSSFFGLPRVKFPSRSGGISITITSGLGKEPKIDIKTYGDYKEIEPEIKKKFGIREKPGIEEVKTKEERPLKIPKVTEEPESRIIQEGGKKIIEIKLPGVKKEEDIEIKRLEQSIEIKAFVGDKAYFKLIPIKPSASIEKEFKEGVLRLKIE